tara:strand:+ start:244 stop:393 length:150 start_codon:yes stop_codon:yes gene_type:complete
MPRVGNKHYSYTPAGKAAAKKAAKKKGVKVKYGKSSKPSSPAKRKSKRK